MLHLIYSLFYKILWAIAWCLKSFFPKVAKGFELRAFKNGRYPWVDFPKNTRPLWIHCQSGEFEYALPLIREFKAQRPDLKILVTYYTPSYVERIHQEPLVDFATPLPWDTAKRISEFISHHQPQQLLIARTGLWPEVLRQCNKSRIPVSLFAMTFTKKLNFWSRWYYRWVMSAISHFYVVSSDDKENLLQVNPEFDITVSGDSRYEQCLYRLQQPSNLKISIPRLQKKLFLAASTWHEDEAVILPFIKKAFTNYHWIIVPHEFDENHLRKLKEHLSPLPSVLYTDVSEWDGASVLIINQFGLLANLYKLSHASFVGGSFKARVHSVMESLACGNLTFVGPYHSNNREALEFKNFQRTSLAPVQVLQEMNRHQEICERIDSWTEQDRHILKQEIANKGHVSQKLVSVLLMNHPKN